ncbi:AfsR/SARP family transcriptional regulator [Micromonospora yasonensis]|uniref:AfsR/SARP family transcriptional regulator n=1 Tax=Micromonospora yasonensis TaxID=1128667 RepID=UPI00222E124C|nr:AfsR/SARP family transcriptional regulator [Micromonospora yasonensis]MCW3842487.1 AfsR/SARP family transcriptional regulator [Micromonospora yasonensis]
MEYGVLGALEVLDERVPVTPTAPKLQSIFAILLVNHNRTVSRDVMINELWPSRPPATATMTLNTYVCQLRKLLAQGPSRRTDLVRSRPGGYSVTVEPETLDLTVFEEALAAGRRELADGRLAEASCELRRALSLHRGPVLAGLSKGRLLAGIAARLEEDVLDATTLRIEIDLRLGRHRELVGELRALVTRHPTNEDLHAKLMVALYRSERRTVALETYQRLRQSLRNQVGIDPSPGLKRLHQDVLQDAPSLLSPDGVAPATPALAAAHYRS